jgi:hypothetical protein
MIFMKADKIIKAAALTGFVFGLAGWLYIVTAAIAHPETLSMQLSHLTPWIREDTFGFLSFLVSGICFFIWNLVRE